MAKSDLGIDLGTATLLFTSEAKELLLKNHRLLL